MVDDIKASFKELVSESEWMGKDVQERLLTIIHCRFHDKLIKLIEV